MNPTARMARSDIARPRRSYRPCGDLDGRALSRGHDLRGVTADGQKGPGRAERRESSGREPQGEGSGRVIRPRTVPKMIEAVDRLGFRGTLKSLTPSAAPPTSR